MAKPILPPLAHCINGGTKYSARCLHSCLNLAPRYMMLPRMLAYHQQSAYSSAERCTPSLATSFFLFRRQTLPITMAKIVPPMNFGLVEDGELCGFSSS